MKLKLLIAGILAAGSMSVFAQPADEDTSLSFFITSVGSGDGANLGGLAGADAHCASLASAVGSG